MTSVEIADTTVTANDLYFVCYMIERTARRLKQTNKYVVDSIGVDELRENLKLAQVLHCDNPEAVSADWEDHYNLKRGCIDVCNVDERLCRNIPTPTQMGKVYARLIQATLLPDEDYASGIVRVYSSPICQIIDDYNSSAFYEPSYYIERAYYNNAF